MLKKILYYDFKNLGTQLLPIYGITLLLALVNTLFSLVSDGVAVLDIVKGFITAGYIIMLVVTPIATFIFSIKYFYTHLLKDEGYLTNTLPVKKEHLLLSQVIISTSYTIISVIVLLIGIWLGFLNHFNFIDIIVDFLNSEVFNSGEIFTTITGMSAPWGFLFMLFILFLSSISQYLFMYTAMMLGQTRNDKKIVYSVVYGIIIYTIQQVIATLFMLAIGFFKPGIFESNNASVSSDILQMTYAFTTIVSIVTIIAYWVISNKILKEKLNLE